MYRNTSDNVKLKYKGRIIREDKKGYYIIFHDKKQYINSILKKKKNEFGTEPIRILKPELIQHTRFENLPQDVIEKIDLNVQESSAKDMQKAYRSRKDVIKLELKPISQESINLNKSNLDKLVKWWKERLIDWGYIEIKNNKIKVDYTNKTITIIYDLPPDFDLNNENDVEDRQINNQMIADPDNNGNYPIYIRNRNIVSINRNDRHLGNVSLLTADIIDEQIIKVRR